MVTAVVSDLHLGGRAKRDLLRDPAVRRALLEGVARADRLVLLGDVLELREGPVGEALKVARPFFEELGEVFAGRPVLMSAGNHDHQVVRELVEERRPLGIEERTAPTGLAARIAGLMPQVELELVYPGVWLRDDVYAMHGHYMDCHNTVPTLERLGAAITERITGRKGRTPDDHEAILTPIYSLLYALAQSGAGGGSGASVGLWQRINDGGPAAAVLSRGVIPAAVAALNRAGLGDFSANVSATELRRAGLRATRDAVRALGIEAEHVIFGHTHRSGPLPWDDEAEWAGLTNTGSWIHEPAFIGSDDPKRSPYWPGTCVFVEENGAPRLERLIEEL